MEKRALTRSGNKNGTNVCIVAGPLYMIFGLIQMAIRPGFDITRHPLSLFSNGELGWIQISNFVVTGALLIAGAFGVKADDAIRTRPDLGAAHDRSLRFGVDWRR